MYFYKTHVATTLAPVQPPVPPIRIASYVYQGEVKLEGLELNRYPDPKQMEVKTLLAKMRGVRPEQIFVGVGSDEAIDLLIRIFCSPGEDTIIVTPPTYGMYKVTPLKGSALLCLTRVFISPVHRVYMGMARVVPVRMIVYVFLLPLEVIQARTLYSIPNL